MDADEGRKVSLACAGRRRKNWIWLQESMDLLQAESKYADKWLVIAQESVVFVEADETKAMNWVGDQGLSGEAVVWFVTNEFFVCPPILPVE